MDVKIDINPEDIKTALTKSIIEGAMGKEIEKAIQSMREYNHARFENAVETAVKSEVEHIVREEVRKKLSGEARELVAKRLTQEYLEGIIEKVVASVGSRW